MAIGTAGAWLAAGSGHAAAQLVDKSPDLERAIVLHESLAVTTRNLFTALTLGFGALMLVHLAARKPLPAPLRVTVHALFLVACLGGAVMLAHTANRGGRLVHEAGVRAIVGPSVAAALPADAPAGERK
jgi:hypothetical protein